jgi:glutamate dehydrogenase (NAD(P)+)
VQFALREFFRHREDLGKAGLTGSLDGKRVIVQGLGNVGYHAAKFLSEEDGCKIIAVIERDGAVMDPKGLNIEDVRHWMNGHGGLLAGYPNATHVPDGAAVLEEPCDILIPAAMEGVIHLGNAERIKAPLIIEAANGPITFGADEILRRKGCVIIPDMYANAGGVTVSYFEWVKNLSHIRFGRMQRRAEEARSRLLVEELERLSADQGLGWSLAEGFKEKFLQGSDELALVRSGLDDTMRTAYQSMREVWHSRQDVEDLRVAAYIVAIDRVAKTYRSKGL